MSELIAERLLSLPHDWRDRRYLWSSLGSLTFGEAEHAALRFTAWLAGAGEVRPGDRVALCLPRSLEAVVAVLGVLASGAAYAPIPYQGPPGRLADMLCALEPKLLLTTAEMPARLRSAGPLPPTALLAVKPGGAGFESLIARVAAAPRPRRAPPGRVLRRAAGARGPAPAHGAAAAGRVRELLRRDGSSPGDDLYRAAAAARRSCPAPPRPADRELCLLAAGCCRGRSSGGRAGGNRGGGPARPARLLARRGPDLGQAPARRGPVLSHRRSRELREGWVVASH